MSIVQAANEALSLLTRRDRGLLGLAALIQVMLSALDLLGVLLFGLVGALAVTTIQSQPPPTLVTELADALGLSGLSEQELVLVFSATAALLLLVKSATSALLNRRVLRFLANRQALVSGRLASKLLTQPITFLQRRSSQETAYALIQGVGTATVSLLGQILVVVTEAAVLVVLATALVLIDPLVTLGAVAFFGCVALVLQRLMGAWASRLGRVGSRADIRSLDVVQEAMSAYREIAVLQRRHFYVDRFQDLRWESASVSADRTFLIQIPKYVFEAAFVIGGLLLAGFLLLTEDSISAAATLALFIAAGSRVMPSLLRLQGAALGLRDNAAAAIPTFDLAHDLRDLGAPLEMLPESVSDSFPSSRAQPVDIEICEATYTYPLAASPAVQGVSLYVPGGTSLALVGRSGAGKSTLSDLIIGVLEPDSGSIQLAGQQPRSLERKSPGLVAYVPQSVALVNGSVRENVALGLPSNLISDDQVWDALAQAHIADLFRKAPRGLETQVGEHGVKLSGGQRQRIGIARAVLSRPSLLVLDEATSALDAETEAAIAEFVFQLQGSVTTVIVAHRLSTVRTADQVAYMEDGHVLEVGTFEELRQSIPALGKQASLMGL